MAFFSCMESSRNKAQTESKSKGVRDEKEGGEGHESEVEKWYDQVCHGIHCLFV